MKKKCNILLTIIICIFSYYYTNMVFNLIKSRDNIMIKIKQNAKKLNQQSVDANIQNDTIIPGLKGKYVDTNKSYIKMKKVNKYSESLIIYKEIKPRISINGQYDKLIISGNKLKKNIAILLKINDISLLKYLDNNINLILEVDFINNNLKYLKTLNNNIIVMEQKQLTDLNLIDYCYATNNFYKYCNSYKKYTIKPLFITYNYDYNTFKNISNGSILAYNITNYKNIQEIKLIISKISKLKYKIISIDELIKE